MAGSGTGCRVGETSTVKLPKRSGDPPGSLSDAETRSAVNDSEFDAKLLNEAQRLQVGRAGERQADAIRGRRGHDPVRRAGSRLCAPSDQGDAWSGGSVLIRPVESTDPDRERRRSRPSVAAGVTEDPRSRRATRRPRGSAVCWRDSWLAPRP